MGNLSEKKEEARRQLFDRSNNVLKDESIEEIMVKTYFDELELLELYKMFDNLNPNENKKIKRESFFDLPMFEFCAFKSLLPNVFNINFEKENTVKDLLGEKKNLHSINNIKDFNVDPNNKYKSKGKLFIIN